ncbi:MAG: hypothetical protein MJA83_12810, partial [Gammaproteobacteria bacterium]|nr:hypothetical protein [Gammaproteobacteria bacterium]
MPHIIHQDALICNIIHKLFTLCGVLPEYSKKCMLETMTVDRRILEVIEEQEIVDQAMLLALLNKEGFALTQPTLSRHLRGLSVRKVNGRYQQVDEPAEEKIAYTLTQAPPNLLVARTRPGHAQVLAVQLDSQLVEGVAGTLAGDDTIFIALDGRL